MNNNRTLSEDPDHNIKGKTQLSSETRPALAQSSPRWFFPADPDKFFSDLIMEQNEQK